MSNEKNKINNSISQEDLNKYIEEFIKNADNNPSNVNKNNCSDGKCCAFEINWNKKKSK